MDSSSFLISVCLVIVLSILNFSIADDIITTGKSIRDGDTVTSSLQSFELGFFSPGNSNNRYVGIWYKISPTTVVWVGNRNNPVTDRNGILTVKDGNLVLLNQDMSIIWSSNSSTTPKNPVAQLLDSGNFVLRDSNDTSSGSYTWQSFDYPLDTLLPGMKLGTNLSTGFERSLTSWKSNDDPSPGDYTFRLDIRTLPQLIISTGSRELARSAPWNGHQFSGIPMSPHNSVFKPRLVENEDETYHTFEPFDNTVITRLIINEAGKLQRLVWHEKSNQWNVLYTWPFDLCDNYAQCGPNGNCRSSNTPCECLKGYVSKSQDEWDSPQTRKCVKELQSDCPSGEGFLKLERMKLPDLEWVNKSMNLKDCKAACTKNCSCRAYANADLVEGGSGCLMWFKDLIDVRECSEGFIWGQDLFLRVPASELHSHAMKRKIAIILVSTISALFILGLVIFIIWKKAKKRGQESREVDSEVPLFERSTIVGATNNFSRENLIGVGGYGPVYKGNLSTGEEIAVKRLSENSVQGAEEFRNETSLIAKLQHKNLVALLGCCIRGGERLLIYEYMPNKSLDYFIYDLKRREFLTWQKRFNIIMGIARGLLYLHQDSKLQIIHRDLKASNILLDNDLNPKISDFGLARIFKGDDEEANTNRVMGTYGYMSPEYSMEGTFSVKSDVFSFGVLLLEIVSGKKNRGFSHPAHRHNLLGHAWLLWNKTRVLELMDPCLQDTFVTGQVRRCVQVGLLCVQYFPENRPDMSSVVFMLANNGATLHQPKEPGFFSERYDIDTDLLPRILDSLTENAVTLTGAER